MHTENISGGDSNKLIDDLSFKDYFGLHIFAMQKTGSTYFTTYHGIKRTHQKISGSRGAMTYYGHGWFTPPVFNTACIDRSWPQCVKEIDGIDNNIKCSIIRNPYSMLFSYFTWVMDSRELPPPYVVPLSVFRRGLHRSTIFVPDTVRLLTEKDSPGDTTRISKKGFKNFIRILVAPTLTPCEKLSREVEFKDISENPYTWIFKNSRTSPMEIIFKSESLDIVCPIVFQALELTDTQRSSTQLLTQAQHPRGEYKNWWDDEMISWVENKWGWLLSMFEYDIHGSTSENVYYKLDNLDVSKYIDA